MSKKKKAIVALIIANILWGISTPLIKWTLRYVPFHTFIFLRMAIPAILMYVFTRGNIGMNKKSFLVNAIAVIIGTVINFYFGVLALEKTQSINAPIISSSGPLFLLMGSILFLHEKPTKKSVLGNILAFFGVLIIVFQPIFTQQHAYTGQLQGNVYLVISTIASVAGTIIVKPIMKYTNASAITFWMFAIGAISFFPSFLNEVQTRGFLPHFTLEAGIGLGYGIVFASVIGYILYYWALKQESAYETGLFTYIGPIITLIIALPLLHEYPSPLFAIGAILVLCGISLAEAPIHHAIQKR